MVYSQILTSTTLTSGTSGFGLPFTLVLKSTDTFRRIELTFDGGLTYIQPSYDIETNDQLVCSVASPVAGVKITGAINDTFLVVTQ